MDREKQIEELKDILLRESNRFYGLECNEACAYCEASAVYDAGYRKESKNYIGTDKVLRSIDYRPVEEVRKETAKEILQEWADDNSSIGLDNTFVKNIAKKYGVEIEE